MSSEIGPEQAKINAHFAAVRDDVEALERGELVAAVERVDAYLREQLPADTDVDTMALAWRAVNAARGLRYGDEEFDPKWKMTAPGSFTVAPDDGCNYCPHTTHRGLCLVQTSPYTGRARCACTGTP